MDLSLIPNSGDALASYWRNLSPRQREIRMLGKYVEGTQYDGMPDFFDNSVPLWQRAPCIVYPLARSAIESHVDLVLGESRFPDITANPGEDDSEVEGLGEEQSKDVDRALDELERRTRYRSSMRDALSHAMAERSVAVLAGSRNGRICLEVIRGWMCTPTLDLNGAVVRLEICYPYISKFQDLDGEWKAKAKLFRRVIDAESDTTFQSLDADKQGRLPTEMQWVVDATFKHRLGFCPVVWYPHLKECGSVEAIDGQALHQHLLDELRGIDYALSQRHRLALFSGSPPIIETGVDPGYNPSEPGVDTPMRSTLEGGAINSNNPSNGEYRSPGRATARKMSPGDVWQYDRENTKVSYLVMPEGSAEVLSEHIADLRHKLCEALAYIPTDSENSKLASSMSGKAIEALRARQFDRCDKIREDVECNLLLPTLQLLLRIALATKSQLPALRKVQPILQQFISDDAAAPMLFLRWPVGYIRPDATEQNLLVTMVNLALTGKIITRRMALEKLSSVFDIDNIDQALEAVEAEAQERQQQAMELMQQKAKLAPPAPPFGGGEKPEAKPDPSPQEKDDSK